MDNYWEHFEHEADIGVRGIASTPAQAFEQVAIAMTAVITNPRNVNPSHVLNIECESDDNEILLFDWMNAIIYEMSTQNMLFSKFHVTLNNNHLTATVSGEKISRQKHQPAVEIKGATFTELCVKQLANGKWMAQCIIDV